MNVEIEIYSKGEIIRKTLRADWYTQEQGFFHFWQDHVANGPVLSVNQIRVASVRRCEWRSSDEDRILKEIEESP